MNRDVCPSCGGVLHATAYTRVSWRARCLHCRRYSHLDDRFEWTPGFGWGVWAVALFWIGLIVLVAWLETNGWA